MMGRQLERFTAMPRSTALAGLAASVVVLTGAAGGWIWAREADSSGGARAAGPPINEVKYECSDAATVSTLRAVPRSTSAVLWVGDVGISLPPDAVGNDVPFLIGSSHIVKMPLAVKSGVEYGSITMEGTDLRTGASLAFDYGGTGFSEGVTTYRPTRPQQPLFGSLSAPAPGVFRLTFSLDGVEQGSTILALCRTASATLP